MTEQIQPRRGIEELRPRVLWVRDEVDLERLERRVRELAQRPEMAGEGR